MCHPTIRLHLKGELQVAPPVAVLHLVAQRRLSKELHVRSRAFCVLRKLKDHEQSAQIAHLDIQGTKGETLEGTLGVI